MDKALSSLKNELVKGIEEGVFPGVVLLASRKGRVIFQEGLGRTTLTGHSRAVEKGTVFDLASLTKPLATSLALMKLVDRGVMGLDQPLADLLPERQLKEKAAITPRLLLTHSAGFEAWQPFYLELEQHQPQIREKILRDKLLEQPLIYEPGEKCLYSDLGFMMLAWLIETASGLSLKEFARGVIYHPLTLTNLFFMDRHVPLPVDKEAIAATEYCPWRKRLIQGEVHDENAWIMGGFSGQAGLFGPVRDIFRLVQCLMEHYHGRRKDLFKPETVKLFFERQNIVPDSTWALGWDTPSPENSSSGRYFSPQSIGHLGFTGTSIWADLEKEIIIVLLTNRVHPDRNNIKIREFRPKTHDLIMEAIFR